MIKILVDNLNATENVTKFEWVNIFDRFRLKRQISINALTKRRITKPQRKSLNRHCRNLTGTIRSFSTFYWEMICGTFSTDTGKNEQISQQVFLSTYLSRETKKIKLANFYNRNLFRMFRSFFHNQQYIFPVVFFGFYLK